MDAHQTSIYNAILLSSAILGIIMLYFIASIIYQQRRNRIMYKRSLEAEIKLLEKERSRIAADLHDDLGPALSSIKFSVGSLDIFSETDTRTVDRVYDHIDSLMSRMREISADMLPHTLGRKGLVTAIEEFISNLSPSIAVKILFEHSYLPELPIAQSVHLYRIVQEIVHNTLKHAHATILLLELKLDGEQLVLLSKDNGCGFDYKLLSAESPGLGLRNLNSRAELLGGKLSVESAPDKGTIYIIEIPLLMKS